MLAQAEKVRCSRPDIDLPKYFAGWELHCPKNWPVIVKPQNEYKFYSEILIRHQHVLLDMSERSLTGNLSQMLRVYR